MADIQTYDETLDPELADLVAAAECIDLRPFDMRRACDVLDHVEPETRFPLQRRHAGAALADGSIHIPDAAMTQADGWD